MKKLDFFFDTGRVLLDGGELGDDLLVCTEIWDAMSDLGRLAAKTHRFGDRLTLDFFDNGSLSLSTCGEEFVSLTTKEIRVFEVPEADPIRIFGALREWAQIRCRKRLRDLMQGNLGTIRTE